MLLCSQWPLFLCSLSCSVRRISFFLSSFVYWILLLFLLTAAYMSLRSSCWVTWQQYNKTKQGKVGGGGAKCACTDIWLLMISVCPAFGSSSSMASFLCVSLMSEVGSASMRGLAYRLDTACSLTAMLSSCYTQQHVVVGSTAWKSHFSTLPEYSVHLIQHATFTQALSSAN